MKIAVIAIQGNVEEHIHATEQALIKEGIQGKVIPVKHSGILPECSGIVLPGGESTTLCRLMKKEGIDAEIKQAAGEHKPILATCAGLIAIAKHGGAQAENTGQELLGIMDVDVDRNAFGRQRESFEALLHLSFLDTPYNAVFIRAPKITRVGKDVEITATLGNTIVGVKQHNILGLSFHPELIEDTRIHQYFIKLIQQQEQKR